MNARVGEIVGPVRTQFGLHIINVTGRDARELKLARIVSKIVASPQTREDVYQRANDFSANAKKADFVQEATSISIEPKEAEVQEKGGFIPGLGVNESVTKWAFKNKIGAVSDAYSIPNGWGVFTIVEVKEAGVKPFNDVKEQFRATVLRNKKIEKLKEVAAGLKEKLAPGDSLTKLASLDSRLQVQRTGEFTLNTSAPGVGRDLNFFGALEAMNVGQISPPITSPRGAYLIQLVAKTSFDSTAFAGQRESLRSQLLQEKRGRYIGEWLTKMKEAANIEDNRDIFFR
jgi:peptidylprolyl isomerase/peptidyl-prolyl cis-trans isomerase D